MRNQLWAFFIVLLLEIMIVGVFTPSDWLETSIRKERVMVNNWLGPTTTQALIERTNTLYKAMFVETGLVRASYRYYIPTEDERKHSLGMQTLGQRYFFPYVKTRIDVMWSAIYQSIQRMILLWLWMPYMLPLFVPAFIDGWQRRAIKKVTYGYASPVRYQTAFMLIVLLLAAIPFYLALPVAVTPLIVPAWAMALSGAVMLLSSNLQKKI